MISHFTKTVGGGIEVHVRAEDVGSYRVGMVMELGEYAADAGARFMGMTGRPGSPGARKWGDDQRDLVWWLVRRWTKANANPVAAPAISQEAAAMGLLIGRLPWTENRMDRREVEYASFPDSQFPRR